MKIGKFFKAIMKTVTVAIAIGSIAYIILYHKRYSRQKGFR